MKVTSLDSDPENPKSLVCLENYLAPSRSWDLSRRERMDLALGLSLAILQVFSTPWIDMWWTYKDFCILEGNKSQIFVTKKFYSTHLDEKTQTTIHSPQSTLFWECVGEPILTRLGFALVELALGKRLSDFRGPEFGSDTNHDMLDLATAKEVVKEGKVLEEAGQCYHDAVQACLTQQIFMPNGVKGLNSRHSDFRVDLETFVVAPVRQVYMASWGQVSKLEM